MAVFAQIESQRLILRRFTEADLEPFLAYRNDPEIARYQTWDSFTEQDAGDFIRAMKQSQPGVPGEYLYTVLEREWTAKRDDAR